MYTIRECSNGTKSGYVCIDGDGNIANWNICPENDAQLFADLYNKIEDLENKLYPNRD